MKNLTADQVLRKTFEHLDQVLRDRKASDQVQESVCSCKKSTADRRKTRSGADVPDAEGL